MKAKKIHGKKQKYERISLQGTALIHDDDHLFAAPLENLSRGGLFLSQLTSMKQGQVVKLVIKSEELAVPFQAEGRVVRVESSERKGIAIEFISLKAFAVKLIENRVSEKTLESELKLL